VELQLPQLRGCSLGPLAADRLRSRFVGRKRPRRRRFNASPDSFEQIRANWRCNRYAARDSAIAAVVLIDGQSTMPPVADAARAHRGAAAGTDPWPKTRAPACAVVVLGH
jgi:hypothetical protein